MSSDIPESMSGARATASGAPGAPAAESTSQRRRDPSHAQPRRRSSTGGSSAGTPSGTGRGKQLRARLGSGDLLLRESEDGLVMSPALFRRRMLTGLATTGRKVLDSSSIPQTSGPGLEDGLGGGQGLRPEADDRHLVRRRSSTLDEHEFMAHRERRVVGLGNTGFGGAAFAEEGRQRTWTYHGVMGHEQDARPSNDWEHLDAFQAMGSMYQQELFHEKSSDLVEVLADRMQVPLLIIFVGVLAALAGMFVDYCCSSARMWRIIFTVQHQDVPFHIVLYAVMSLCFTLGMCAVTHYICPLAAGGGVPEMKAVLSGAGRPGLLSSRLVVVKIMGVIVANAAGLSVGKEGPLIHITCALADLLMSTKAFRGVRLNTMKRLEILACACAAGVAATFGSVFGGTLFSVEVTATAYMVETLPATFLCAVVVAVVFWMSGQSELFTLISDETAQAQGFTPYDLLAWCLLGMVCGLVGAAFVAVLDALSRRRNFFTRKDLDNSTRKKRIFAVVALCTLLIVPTSFIEAVSFSEIDSRGRNRFRPLVDEMYSQRVFGVSWTLPLLLLLKVWTTIFSVVQPLPLGLFSPVFVIGGLMGRIFGEVALWLDRYFTHVNINFKPWEFALIGSAAFSAGVTRAVSTAVIVFELSGQNHLRLPLGVALMISYFIANRFTKGVYDALMDTNGTPHLQEVSPEDRNVPAEDVMIPVDDIPCLSLACTGQDASEVVALCQPGQVIPVVQSMTDKVLVGVVLWNDLAIALADYRRRGSILPSPKADNGGISGSTGNGNGISQLGYGAASTAAASAAAAEGQGEFVGEVPIRVPLTRTGSDGWRSWPKLNAVVEAVGSRVRWLPRMRTAEPALLEQLDMDMTEEGDEEADEEEGKGSDPDSTLPLLGPGIPWMSPAGRRGSGSGDNSEKNPLLSNPAVGESAAVSSQPLGNAEAPDQGAAGVPPAQSHVRGGGGTRASRRKKAATLTASARANRALLRFFLVREGHKFVAVGRARRKGAWREMPALPSAHGVPIVLDPSPYQVTHTTELCKVDMAFRLLRLDNAYVCNAGRLVGVVTRGSLRDFMEQREISPMDECMSLCGAFACCVPRRLSRAISARVGSPFVNNTTGNDGGAAGDRAVAAAAAVAAAEFAEKTPLLGEGLNDSYLRKRYNASPGTPTQRRGAAAGRDASARGETGVEGPTAVGWMDRRRVGYSTLGDTAEEGEGEMLGVDGASIPRGVGPWHPV